MTRVQQVVSIFRARNLDWFSAFGAETGGYRAFYGEAKGYVNTSEYTTLRLILAPRDRLVDADGDRDGAAGMVQ